MPECAYRQDEDMLVGAIGFALIREAKVHGVEAQQLLANVLRPLSGILKAHLGRNPQVCTVRMAVLLRDRLDRVKCPNWGVLLRVATNEGIPNYSSLHVPHCPLCQRDVAQIKAKLPYYDEFYLPHGRLNEVGNLEENPLRPRKAEGEISTIHPEQGWPGDR